MGSAASPRSADFQLPSRSGDRTSELPHPRGQKGLTERLRPTAACVTEKPCEPQSWLVTRVASDEKRERRAGFRSAWKAEVCAPGYLVSEPVLLFVHRGAPSTSPLTSQLASKGRSRGCSFDVDGAAFGRQR